MTYPIRSAKSYIIILMLKSGGMEAVAQEPAIAGVRPTSVQPGQKHNEVIGLSAIKK